MTGKWTEGEWQVEPDEGWPSQFRVSSRNGLIAVVGNADNSAWETWKANARLISQAPAMADVLQELCEVLERVPLNHEVLERVPLNNADLPPIYQRARALLSALEDERDR